MYNKHVVLKYDSYFKMNEEKNTQHVSFVDQILDIFFQAYGITVTKIGEYKDSIKDLTNIAEKEDKSKVFTETLNKIINLVNDEKYDEALSYIKEAGKALQNAYNNLIKNDEDQNELEKINDKIYKKIISYQESLKSIVPDIKHIKESVLYFDDDFLLEKNTFKSEREELIKKITPIYTQVANLSNNSPDETLKRKSLEISKKLKSTLNSLNNEEEWNNRKRKDRIKYLEEISTYVNNIPNELNKIQSDALIKMGVNNKITKEIEKAIDYIEKATESLKNIENIKINNLDDLIDKSKKIKEISYKPIKSGNVNIENLKTTGKNFKRIKEIQEKMNLMLSQNEKIKVDGLYGDKTEKAVKIISSRFSDISPNINKNTNGKEMDTSFIKLVDNYKENINKIRDIFKEGSTKK